MVARKVRDALSILLRSQLETKLENDQNHANENGKFEGMRRFDDFMDEDGCESMEAEDTDKVPEMYVPLKKSILKAFKLMDKELKLHPTIDCFCSGTTAVALIKQGQDLIIGNVGDSRAVLATRDKDNALVAVQLTVDLKPNLPREAARIQKCKGRVFALQDEPEVARVWLPNSDSPGLAMARAFGDFCLKDFGLISIPDVYHHHITERDQCGTFFRIRKQWTLWPQLPAVVQPPEPLLTVLLEHGGLSTQHQRMNCAVVCLFLEHVSVSDVPQAHNDPATVPEGANKVPQEEVEKVSTEVDFKDKNVDGSASHAAFIVPQGTTKESSEIVPVVEEVDEKPIDKTLGQSKRSLAECLSTAEDDDWSALEEGALFALRSCYFNLWRMLYENLIAVRAPSSFPNSKIQVKKHCAKFIV
ncbi:UNVERIFIED_CONTAM: putative protein phosphatase 2C 66 [Sesamum radiatum]|uniref:PPM-type phosphatase domain-containing protein n=1 Tax=Sesamum radiatum TaxID=300843 RepID=A0AAW2KIS7_SESRA